MRPEIPSRRKTSGRRPAAGNLPAEPDHFVGRAREVEETARLLSRARLVTVTGMGGVGKTRLAVRVAGVARTQFPDGAWLAELAELADVRGAELVDRVVAEALGAIPPGDAADSRRAPPWRRSSPIASCCWSWTVASARSRRRSVSRGRC